MSHNPIVLYLIMVDWKEYFKYWYPLPDVLPEEVKAYILEYVFDPLRDPW